MNIPNSITLLRIIITPIFVNLLIYDYIKFAILIFVIAVISDGLDGFVARVQKNKTLLGAYLDPLADKMLIITSYVTLSILNIFPSWITVIVISRDVMILLGIAIIFLTSKDLNIKPSIISKLTTLSQFVTIFVFLSYNIFDISFNIKETLLFMTATFTIASGLHYLYKGMKILNH
jgi:cardiolipin synthase